MENLIIEKFGEHIGNQINELYLQKYIQNEKENSQRKNLIKEISNLTYYGHRYFEVYSNEKGKTYQYVNNKQQSDFYKRCELAEDISLRRYIKRIGYIPSPFTGQMKYGELQLRKGVQKQSSNDTNECKNYLIKGILYPTDIKVLVSQLKINNGNIIYTLTPYSHLSRGIPPMVHFQCDYNWYVNEKREISVNQYLQPRCPARALKCFLRNSNL